MARILVVDNDVDICELLALRLQTSGHDVVVERDGEAALDALERDRFDLMLLDWMMPRLGGIEVCLAVRAVPELADLTILMLTTRAQASDVDRGLAAGADDYLLKPFSPRQVAARVSSALAHGGRAQR